MRPPEHASSSPDQGRDMNNSAPSTIQVSSVNQVNLPTKIRSKRKIDVRKPAIRKGIKSSDNIVKGKISRPVTLFHDGALDLKVTLFTSTTEKLSLYILGFPPFMYVYILYDRKSFVTSFVHTKHGDGVPLNGSIVQLIIHGLLKWSLWSIWIM